MFFLVTIKKRKEKRDCNDNLLASDAIIKKDGLIAGSSVSLEKM